MTPPMLLVTSGKGGVGTSVVTALCALAAAERGMRVLLVDAGESGGTQHHLFGIRPEHSLWMLTSPRTQTTDVLVTLSDALTLVPGGTSGTQGTAVPPTTDVERREALQRLAEIYERFDLVLFDGGSRLDSITAIGDLTAPSILLVTSADRLALAANYALVKSVHSRRPDLPVSVVANRHGEALSQEACGFLVGACTHFLGRTIAIAGSIPDDPCLQAAVGAGMTMRDAVDGSPAAEAVRAVVTSVLPSPAIAISSSLPRRWS